ncbi:MAG: threonine aldolase [Acidobacteria bacterium RIFCSPHIGHO2_12_FULL_67_30]|nr:MAG: threonine aldolase [Acidobacteria bacterium RIFCSPHIGHO2_02_FULL_67_57]OFV85552.1 MAG: threonine aldolase [Acidobacteria bacterium RIFCSPHIGHO2_01_FULL_67_28]OFV89212.1 MAG: threonine aldolase [Acidobacteria bacterium RIFCSPHIGHO2_12_FULL_67_30]
MPEWIDLRSDTVTKPTLEMRRAMAEAEVGDDVYGEDPTVNRLEQRAAEIFQREAALFVPTGSMGNLICIRIHCDHGNEVICESRGHIFNFEMASMSAIAGCVARPVETTDGVLTWKHIEPAIRPKVYYRAQTGLISLENTHNIAGGRVLPTAVQDEICDRAHDRGIPVHLDAARIFNAATYLGKSVADITRKVDSLMFCLSKGLGAPVGSMVVGSRAFIEKARVFRKMFGGGMRQVGVLAAAGLVALEKHPPLLARDHAKARRLAEALAEIPDMRLQPNDVQTNILVFDVPGTGMSAPELSAKLKERGVLANAVDPKQMRMVTHYDVSEEEIERAIRAAQEIFAAARKN